MVMDEEEDAASGSEDDNEIERGRVKVIVIGSSTASSGKTTIVAGLVAALRRRGLRCSAFKLGADLIDPALYSSLCGGLPCATLDSWCMNQQQMHQVISRDIQTQTNRQTGTSRTLKSAHGKGTESSSIAVIDGTTGLEGFEVYNSDGDNSNSKYNDDYDNTMNEITERMTSDVCRMLHAPFIEIVDCLHRKQIDSLSSPNTKFAIFNKGSQKSEIQREPRSSSRVKEEEDQSKDVSMINLGNIPFLSSLENGSNIKSASMSAQGRAFAISYVDQLADAVEKYVDVDAILDIVKGKSHEDSGIICSIPRTPKMYNKRKVRIGVAKDESFSYYYRDNLYLLEEAGAEIVCFSPMHDSFPESVQGLYLSGGVGFRGFHSYHDNGNQSVIDTHDSKYNDYASNLKTLSNNREMLAAILEFARRGGVIYGECAGLTYLTQSIETMKSNANNIDNSNSSNFHTMCGVFPFRTRVVPEIKMGYVEVEVMKANPFFKQAQRSRGHVCHFTEIVQERVVMGSKAFQAVATNAGTDQNKYERGTVLDRRDSSGWEVGYTAWPQKSSSSTTTSPFLMAVPEGYSWLRVLASYVHVHFASNIQLAMDLVEACRQVPSNVADLAKIAGTSSAQNNMNQPQLNANGDAVVENGSSFHPSKMTMSPTKEKIFIPPGSDETDSDENFGESFGDDSSLIQRKQSFGMKSMMPRVRTGEVPFTSLSFGQEIPEHDIDNCTNRSTSSKPSIVSLLPSCTEILFALGQGDRVIGISDQCDYPTECQVGRRVVCWTSVQTTFSSPQFQSVESGREYYEGKQSFTLDDEWFQKMRPELVLTNDACDITHTPESAVTKAFRRTGFFEKDSPTNILVIRPRTLVEVLESITLIGSVTGCAEIARSVIESLRLRLRHVVSSIAASGIEQKPRVLSLEGINPLISGGHWMPEMKRLAGGIDEMQEAGDQADRLSWDQIRAYSPDILVLLASHVGSITQTLLEAGTLAEMPGFWSIPAVACGRVYICDDRLFSRPGPRLVDGVEVLARIFHPEKVDKRIPEGVCYKLVLPEGQRCRPSHLHEHFHAYV